MSQKRASHLSNCPYLHVTVHTESIILALLLTDITNSAQFLQHSLNHQTLKWFPLGMEKIFRVDDLVSLIFLPQTSLLSYCSPLYPENLYVAMATLLSLSLGIFFLITQCLTLSFFQIISHMLPCP